MNQFARPGLAVTQLPSFNENDKGKVLTINSESGALGWEEGSGGGSSGGGVLVVHVDEGDTFDKTWQEVHDAFSAGVTVIAVNPSGYQCLIVGDGGGKRYFVTVASQSNWSGGTYATSSADGYPVYLDA